MKLSLVSWKKLGFIDGRISKAIGQTVNNGLLLSWIIISVILEISCTIMHLGSVADAWQELKDRHKQTNAPKKHQICFDLTNLK